MRSCAGCNSINGADSWPGDNKARALSMAARMGYHVFVSEATVTKAGSKLSVAVTVENKGVAPPYYPLHLQ